MAGRFIFCISFLIALIQSAASEDLRKKHLNTVAHQDSDSDSEGTAKEDKPIGIFSRRRSQSPPRQQVTKLNRTVKTERPRPETGNTSPGSRRQCARVMESCSIHVPCCNPCALCHCRLFNTICQCWRIGVCSKKN